MLSPPGGVGPPRVLCSEKAASDWRAAAAAAFAARVSRSCRSARTSKLLFATTLCRSDWPRLRKKKKQTVLRNGRAYVFYFFF